ncbi:MAG: glycine cleavage system aminomethyltransferase GcvT [Pirellulales bacterium]
MTSPLARTPLYDWHAAHGGRLVDFAGWEMPVQYTSIVTEHVATRSGCGLFDVSHMARFRFTGAHAGEFLDSLLTRRVADMRPGQIRYSLVTNETGGILDDVLVYCLPHRAPKGDTEHVAGDVDFALVVNASNRAKIATWIAHHLVGRDGVTFVDRTLDTAMIAAQGPRAIALAQPLVDVDLATMKYYTAARTKIAGHDSLVSRTGYTGEDGVELIMPGGDVALVWAKLIDAGATAAGLGARDTLRLEAAMPLYGHELTEEIDPIQAGLKFAVNLKDRSFPGRDAIERRLDDPSTPRRVGLLLEGKRVPREGYALVCGTKKVGAVTSGTFSPTLDKPIAMGYVEPESAAVGTKIAIDIRGREEPAQVVALPFYSRRT